VSLVLSVVLILGMATLSSCASTTSAETGPYVVTQQQQGIQVSGSGTVKATPDIAVLTLGVQAQSITVAEAQAQATEAMNKVIAALKDNGVADKDIQTQYLTFSRFTLMTAKCNPTITSYQVTNTVTAKVRDVSKAGDSN